MPETTTSTNEFTPGLQAPDILRFVPPAPPGFHSFAEYLFDQALKEFTNEDTADATADACAVIMSDADNPYTQHVYDALRLLVCHAQMRRVQQAISDQFMARFRQANADD
jgi:tellurite resistance protein